MTDERCKKIMKALGMPNSTSLKLALEQVVNETARETIVRCLAAIEKIPVRIEPLSGQKISYIQRGEVIDAIRQ